MRRLFSLVLPLVVACTSGPTDQEPVRGASGSKSTSALTLALTFDSNGAHLAGVTRGAVGEDQPGTLKWIVGGASGTVPDPRSRTTEVLGDAGLGHATAHGGGAILLAIPASEAGGELVLSDDQGEVARLGLGDGPQVTRTAHAQSVGRHGECGGPVNVLVMPEGFTEAEMPAYRAAVARLVADFNIVPAFSDHPGRFNFWSSEIASRESGLERDTAWNVRYGVAPNPQRAIYWHTAPKEATWAAYAEARSETKADLLVVLVNARESLGSADAPQRIVVQSIGAGAYGLAHEIGHALLGLADEYADGTCLATAGRRPNATRTPAMPPWSAYLPERPIEGADSCVSGVWKPTDRCLMHRLGEDLCPVCAKRLVDVLALRERQSGVKCPPANCTGESCAAGLVCSENGGVASCCKRPFPIATICYSDEDCASGEVCARANAGQDGPTFGCTRPNAVACER